MSATAIPLTLSIQPVQQVEDGGDGKPWTRWALVGEAEGASGAIAEAWVRGDASTADVLAAVFRALSVTGAFI